MKLVLIGISICMASASSAEVTITRPTSNTYHIEGSAVIQAPIQIVWNVLTDFEGMPLFVPSVKSSRIVSREGDCLIVEQIILIKKMMFHKQLHLMLRVRSHFLKLLHFQDLAHKDFRQYQGSWTMQSQGNHTKITYTLDLEPKFSVPDFFLRASLERGTNKLVRQIQGEIERRTNLK